MNRKRLITLGLVASSVVGLGAGAAIVTAKNTEPATPAAMLDTATPETRQAIQSANHLSTAFRAVADHVLPSVVAIENRPKIALINRRGESDPSIQPSADPFGGQNPLKGTPFEELFREFGVPGDPNGRMPRRFGQNTPRPSAGIGSGVIIDASGIILTNNHVVADGEVTIRLQDGREFLASKVWTDPDTDIAVVKIDGAENLVPAMLGDSDDVSIGDWVVALGQPFGLESTVTAGIISAKHRGIGITERENFLQTDAAINPGNSGGPLVNLEGKVIGINTAISSRGGGNDGIGFAVPSNLARWVSDQLRESGTVRRAYLGVGIQSITQDLARAMDVAPRQGVLVTDVYPETPAKAMGLQTGDVILSFAGKAIASPRALQLAVERSPINQDVDIKVLRDGKTLTLKYRGTESDPDFVAKAASPNDPQSQAKSDWGMEVAELTSDVAKSIGIEAEQGVVITSVDRGSPSDLAGLKPGMVVVEANRTRVDSTDAFASAIKSRDGDRLLLLVRTEGGSRFIVLRR